MAKTKPLQLFVVYAALSLVIYTINIDKGAVPSNEASPGRAVFKTLGRSVFIWFLGWIKRDGDQILDYSPNARREKDIFFKHLQPFLELFHNA